MKISDKYYFYDKKELKMLKKVLENKQLSGTSNFIDDYEKNLCNFFKSKYSVALSSGTAAIQTALFSLNIKRGDKVIVSSICPSMSVVPIIALGAIPVFCDTNEDDFGLNINDLKKIIDSKTKAAIEVPMWGYPTNVFRLRNFLKKYKIPLILDLAQAHGTKYKEKYLSNYGDISCFSTHDKKILSTGEGGFTLTNNRKYFEKMQSYIKFGNMNGRNFGLNFKLGSLQAGIGINRIKFINKQIKLRTSNAKYILKKIKNKKIKEFKVMEKSSPNYYALLLEIKQGLCFNFINYLEKNNIPSDIKKYKFKVLYEYSLFKKYKRACQNSKKLSQKITTIPVHPGLNKLELDYIVRVINNFT